MLDWLCGGKWVCLSFAAILVGLIGWADYLTGYEASLSVVYLIPIAVATWYGGRPVGLALAVVSAAAELFADLFAGLLYSSIIIHVWNAAAKLMLFSAAAVMLGALRAAFERERQMARTDALTGLANRQAFFERGQIELARSRRSGRPLTIAYLDLDHFKEVNDQLGHVEGDAVLRVVAGTIARTVRQTDVVARLGGDEFVILFPELDHAHARDVLTSLRLRLLESMRAHSWPTTFSCGGVVYERPPASLDPLLQRADECMFTVKRNGRDAVRLETDAEVAPDSEPRPANAGIG